jgi:PrtD family type I secretion system ABC transporter
MSKNIKSSSDIANSKKPIRALLISCRRTFYFAFALTFLIDALSLAPIVYMMSTFDRVISARSGITLVSLTVIVIAVYIFWSAMEWIRTRLLVSLSLRIDWDLGAKVFDASFRRHVGRKGVNVQQLLGDMVALRHFFTGSPILALMDAPFAVIFIIIGGIFHPYLAIFAAVASVIMLIAAYATQRISGPILKEANDAKDEASRVAAESVRQAESTLALGMMPAIRQRWYKEHRRFLLNQVNASEAAGLTGGISDFFQKAFPSLQMALGAYLAINNLITSGMVMAATMLISKSIAPIQKLIGSWKDIVEARQAFDRLNELLVQDFHRESRMKLPPVLGKLTVTAATAVPPGANKAVVGNINFAANPGEAIAIVGPSASGKTSLVRMLVGIWAPVSGSVRLDGVEISDWDHEELGPQIGYVPQDIEFYDGTVAENISRFGDVDAEKVVQAAKIIGMHEVILSFPDGYDTKLGATGFALSGGQRQRIAIARALYGFPKYIVMDEPNANLDEVGEAILVQAIQFLKSHGATIVITTHRPRLVGAVERLLVMREGLQVGFGPAEEMLNAVRNLQVVPTSPESKEPQDQDSSDANPAVLESNS